MDPRPTTFSSKRWWCSLVRTAKPSASVIAELVSCSSRRRFSIESSKDLLPLRLNYSLCTNLNDVLEPSSPRYIWSSQSKCFRVWRHEDRGDPGGTGTLGEDWYGRLFPAHGVCVCELGFACTGDQGGAGPGRRAVCDRPPRPGSRRRGRPPVGWPYGTAHGEPPGLGCLAGRVLGRAAPPGPRPWPPL